MAVLNLFLGTAFLTKSSLAITSVTHPQSSRISVRINHHGTGSTDRSDSEVLAGDAAALIATDERQTRALELRSHQLSKRLFSAAESPHISDATRTLLRSFRICANCRRFQRFGERDDGGYLMCLDDMLDTSKGEKAAEHAKGLKAAISMGVAEHDRWSYDIVSTLHVPVYQFDCTVKTAPACKGCQFYEKCLAPEKSKKAVNIAEVHDFPAARTYTMPEALAVSGQGHSHERSLLLKMDIEGREWSVLESASDDWLQKFQQIILEFHFLKYVEKHPNYVLSMQKLVKNGFRVAHLHGNNIDADGAIKMGDYTIPNVLEVTFIAGDSHKGTCQDIEQRLPLDARNDPKKPELPLSKFPDRKSVV